MDSGRRPKKGETRRAPRRGQAPELRAAKVTTRRYDATNDSNGPRAPRAHDPVQRSRRPAGRAPTFQGRGRRLEDAGTGRTVTAPPQTTAVLICWKSSSSLTSGASTDGRRSTPSAKPRLQPVARFMMSSILSSSTPTSRKASRRSISVTEALSPPTKNRAVLERRPELISSKLNHREGPSLADRIANVFAAIFPGPAARSARGLTLEACAP